MKKSVKKNVTLGSLDNKIDQITNTVDTLAISVARGFASVDQKFVDVKKGLSGEISELGVRVEKIEETVKNTNHNILNIGDKFVGRYEFENLVVRFGHLEKKVDEKMKK